MTLLRSGNVHNLISIAPRFKTDLYKNFFVHRIVKLWDKLPVDTKSIVNEDVETNTIFKKSIVQYYENKMMQDIDCGCTLISFCNCGLC